MITTALILVLLYILQTAVNVLPTGTLPAGVYSAFTSIQGYLAGWNGVFPISEMFTVLQAVVAFQATVWGFQLIIWVYGRIRGVSAK